MPLLQHRPAKRQARILKIRPNPGLQADDYYDVQTERFPKMMEALGKY